jgi:outer membrane protein OmpA-like peptidoglycan-associated protein
MNKIFAFLLVIFVSLGCSLFDGLTGKKEETNATPKAETKEVSESSTPETQENTADISDKKDLLSIGAGTNLVKASSEYTPNELGRWSAFGLIDESKKVGWAGEKDKITDQTIVFELPAKTTFKTIGFDTEQTDTDAAAKDVMVEISDTSADSGFETILSTSLKDKTDGQDFPVEKEVGGRFIKITAKNNHGSKEWLEIIEVRGYGEQEPQKPFEKNVSGTYETGRYGNFHIKQEGTSIVGCYEFDGGMLEGGLDGRIMTLTWKETGDKEDDTGPAVFLFDNEGKNFDGFWTFSTTEYYSGRWDGEKISDEVGNCEHFKNLSSENAAGSQIEKELEKDGRAAVYGINFDFNSDKIKDESKPTLDQIVNILKENSGWKMTIEGHTDKIGGETFNQNLSEKRANSVKEYLKNAGIDESRLTAKGVGMSSPVATNDTEAGRARNRRVELVKE